MLVETCRHFNDLADTFDLDVVVELGSELRKGFLEVNLARVYVLEEKVTSFCLVKDLVDGSVKQFLNQIKPRFWSLLEKLFINAPEFKLHLEHLWILLVLLVHLTTISDKVNHQVECEGVSIHKNFVILCLESVPAREQSFECAPLE